MKSTRHLSMLAMLATVPVFAQNQPPAPGAPGQRPAPLVVPAVALTPAQMAHILKELEKVEAQIGQGRGGVFSTALAKFRAATGSDAAALALYLDCYKLEHFDRKDLKTTDFTEWRERNEERLKDADFGKALVLQLEYLVLTIQAQEINDIKKMGPVVTALQAYIAKAVGEVQASTKHTASGAVELKETPKGGNGGGARRPGGGGGGQGQGGGGGRWGAGDASPLAVTLRQSVKGTEFCNAYLLDDYLTLKEWEYTPLNIAGIYGSVIFPYYRSEKPEELGAQWDMRINAEHALRKAVLSESEYAIYFGEQNPRLQWQKQSDLLTSNVNPVNALAEMLKIIQGNPNHPDAATWLDTFKTIMEKAGGEPPVEKPIGSQ
ncbi:MAG: hypothetical protein ACO1TE_26350 [Prosthecobacter sp.]